MNRVPVDGGAVDGGAVDGGAVDGGAVDGGAVDGAAVEALHARLSDLALVEPAGLVAGLDPERGAQLLLAFAADLRATLSAADQLLADLTSAPPPSKGTLRTEAASRWALAARLERMAARVATRLEALPAAADSPR